MSALREIQEVEFLKFEKTFMSIERNGNPGPSLNLVRLHHVTEKSVVSNVAKAYVTEGAILRVI